MRAYAYSHYGLKQPGKIIDLPEPEVGPADVLVDVEVASINPIDFKILKGDLRFVSPAAFPLVLGGDAAGIVRRTGTNATRVKPGDKVYFRIPKLVQGTFAESVSLPESCVAPMPEALGFAEAASLPLVALTSWQALFEVAALKAGDRVYIPAGSGGIGSVAIQLAKAKALYVATSTSSRNLAWVKELGADLVLDYTQGDPCAQLKDFDAVYDTLGGPHQASMFKTLKPGGILVSIVGPVTEQTAKELGVGRILTFLFKMMSASTRCLAKRAQARYQFFLMRPDGAQLEVIGNMVDAGKLRPVIDRTYPLEKVHEAMSYLATGRARGKVLIQIRQGQ